MKGTAVVAQLAAAACMGWNCGLCSYNCRLSVLLMKLASIVQTVFSQDQCRKGRGMGDEKMNKIVKMFFSLFLICTVSR